MVERVPAELVHHRRHEDRRVGDAPGDHDLRSGLQRLHDRLGAEVDLGGDELRLERRGRPAVLHDGVGQLEHAVGDQAAAHRRDLHAALSVLAQPVHDALGSAFGIDPALVRHDARAAPQAPGQHRLHAIVEIGVVARERRVAPRAHLGGRHRRLRHRLEAQVIEIALLGVERRRLDAVAPPRRPGADADGFCHSLSDALLPRALRSPDPGRARRVPLRAADHVAEWPHAEGSFTE